MQFFIGRITFDELGPARAAELNAVETRLKLPPDQVNMLITAGRDALSANPKFRAFLTSLGRAPPPRPRPPVATPVASEAESA